MTEAFDVGPIPSVFTDSVLPPEPTPYVEVAAFDRSFPVVSETDMGSRFVFWESSRELKRGILGGAVPSYSHDWDRDCGRWNWSTGTFVFSKPPAVKGASANELAPRLRISTRMVVYGVEFDRAAVEKIAQSFGGKVHQPEEPEDLPLLYELLPTGRSKGGMHRDAPRWKNFWTEAAKIMAEGRLNKSGFNSQAELREELIGNMGPHPFSEDAIKKAVRKIWHVYVEPTRRG